MLAMAPLLMTCLAIAAQPVPSTDVVWQIGQHDDSHHDLVFDGVLNSYGKTFPNDVVFTVGKDEPKRDFSGHQAR